jgi:poly(ADP-ribose) glycohydrolase ARH3
MEKGSRDFLTDKFRGALLGALVGDALGQSVIGWDPARLAEIWQQRERLPVGSPYRTLYDRTLGGMLAEQVAPGIARYSDDGQMLLAVAESLARVGGFIGADVARSLTETHEPHRCYHSATTAVLMALRRGTPWQVAGRNIDGGAGAFDAGAAVRVAPLALLYHDQDAACRRQMADLSASITHIHQIGRDGAVLQAAAVARAAVLAPDEPVDPATFLTAVRSDLCGGATLFHAALEMAGTRLARPEPPTPEEIAGTLGNGCEAHRAVPAALYAFLAHPDSLSDAVLFAVRMGGAADTLGALCGALAGARHGEAAIPSSWLTALENGPRGADFARDLADRLVTAFFGQDRERLMPK